MIVLCNNLIRMFKKKSNLLFMLIVPIVLNVIFVIGVLQNESVKLAIIDKDNTELTSEFQSQMMDKFKIVTMDISEVDDAVINSKVDAAIIINEGTTELLSNGNNCSVEIYSIKESNASVPIETFTNGFFKAAKIIGEDAKGDLNKFNTQFKEYLKNKISVNQESLDSEAKEKDNAVSSLGFLAMGMMFLLGTSTTMIIKDKKLQVFNRIMVSPLKSYQYYLQNIISYILIAIVQIVLVVEILNKFFNLNYGNNIINIMIMALMFALFCISFGSFISRFSKDEKQANAIISFVNLPLLMLGGCLWSRSLMPNILQQISNFLPTTWFLKGAETIIGGQNVFGAYQEVLLLIGLSIILFILSFININKNKIKG